MSKLRLKASINYSKRTTRILKFGSERQNLHFISRHPKERITKLSREKHEKSLYVTCPSLSLKQYISRNSLCSILSKFIIVSNYFFLEWQLPLSCFCNFIHEKTYKIVNFRRFEFCFLCCVKWFGVINFNKDSQTSSLKTQVIFVKKGNNFFFVLWTELQAF